MLLPPRSRELIFLVYEPTNDPDEILYPSYRTYDLKDACKWRRKYAPGGRIQHDWIEH